MGRAVQVAAITAKVRAHPARTAKRFIGLIARSIGLPRTIRIAASKLWSSFGPRGGWSRHGRFARCLAPFLEALHHDEKRRDEQHCKAGRRDHAGEHRDSDRLART